MARPFRKKTFLSKQLLSERGVRSRPQKSAMMNGFLEFSKIFSCFALCEVICDKRGKPCDCRIMEINSIFEKITGLQAKSVVGKTILEVLPDMESSWIDAFGKVALTGHPVHFEGFTKIFNSQVEVLAFSPKRGQFATVFNNLHELLPEETLQIGENSLRALAENSNSGFLIAMAGGRHVYASRRVGEITGSSTVELMNAGIEELIHPDEKARIKRKFESWMKGQATSIHFETRIIKKDGDILPVEVAGAKIIWGGQLASLLSIRDITAPRRIEDELGKFHNELSRCALALKNASNELEIKRKELSRRKLELEKANSEMVQANTAFSVLARNIDKQKTELEQDVALAVSSKIMPIVKELRRDKSFKRAWAKLEMLTAYLNDLPPVVENTHNIIVSLSPAELQIAILVKDGFTSEDIARMLFLSLHTVKTHRKNIRKKLKINSSNINLNTYLRSYLQ